MEKDYNYDPAKARDSLVNAIKEISEKQGFGKAVLGISGGKDSTVTAALLARALGPENVYGVMLPDGQQTDLDDSKKICDALGINCRVINIGGMHAELREITDQNDTGDGRGSCCGSDKDVSDSDPCCGEAADGTGECGCGSGRYFDVPYSRESDINVGPRLRMTVLRYIAQALGARLAGTGNLSEATVGYCTKDGDTSCDFAVLLGLTSAEVVEMGLTMPEIPREFVVKTPTDGLSGVSDEVKLGVSYDAIHKYIRFGTSGDASADEIISAKERANRHKRSMPVILDPGF